MSTVSISTRLLQVALIVASFFSTAARCYGSDSLPASLTSSSQVTLTTLNCVASAGISKPSIIVRDVTRGRGPERTIVPLSIKANIFASTAIFTIPSGPYTVIVSQGGCSDIFDMSTLNGLARNIVVAPNRMVFIDYHNHNSLTGVLPFRGLEIDLLLCVSKPCDASTLTGFEVLPVAVDGDAYYANQLPPAQWYLRLRFASICASVVIPIEGTDKTRMNYMHFQREISAEEIQALWMKQRTVRHGCF
jgi:hypothetical protein